MCVVYAALSRHFSLAEARARAQSRQLHLYLLTATTTPKMIQVVMTAPLPQHLSIILLALCSLDRTATGDHRRPRQVWQQQ
jgi:hypothetical protein